VNLLSSASGSQPQGNTKNSRIQRTLSKAKKNKLEDHHRTIRPSLNKKKSVVDTKAISSVTNSKLNVNADLKCATCNGCLFFDNHDSCVLAYMNYVNARLKSKSVTKPKFLGMVKFGNDHVAKIMGYSDYKIGNVTISRVYFMEGLGHNLFSMGQFCDSDLEVTFCQHTCFICNLDGVDLETGSRGNNLFTLSLQVMMASSPICLLSKASKTKSWLWHRQAVATTCYTQNRSIIRLRHGKTPYELLHNKLLDLSFLYVFGALCYPANDNIDELTVMASEQSSSGPALNEMTPATISSGLVQKPSSLTTYIPPSRNDWDLLFQPMFDELLNPSPSVDPQALEVIALIAKVIPPVQALDIEVAHMENDPLIGVPIPEATSA
nr:integrase, catalytic region, zinc finger, CCHC-type, peptidase aspartic, catalytic [Tanacetum cinerariifolium]